jgi:hypothetical protein
MSRAIASAVAAGSAAIGRDLAVVAVLPGSDRSAVLRCRDPGCRDSPGSTVIVKSFPSGEEGSFAAEAAGLALTGDAGLGPVLLAADPAGLTVVMSDLGSGPSLADLLLDGPPAAAADALLDWAAALGALAVAAAGREREHAGRLAEYLAGRRDESYQAGLGERIRGAAGPAVLLGITVPAGLDADLAQVAEVVDDAPFAVYSPGDECPDNNLLRPDGIRFLDHESAGFHSVFLDAAYLRMPFSTCWCVFRLPGGLAARAESRYRAAVTGLYPELADDRCWQAGVCRAVAAWTLSSLWWLSDRALAADEPLADDRPAPRRRQLCRYRWRLLARELAAAGELPALAELTARLLAATEHWDADSLPGYPGLAGYADQPPRAGLPDAGHPR